VWLCLWLAGCASWPLTPATRSTGSAPPNAQASPGQARGGSASAALLEQSRSEQAAGDFAAAAASLERALRITPNDPALWLQLGELNLARGDEEQAAMMARKALTLAGGDSAVESRASRLLERAAGR
jgi:Flp pilus assembly protein TadD